LRWLKRVDLNFVFSVLTLPVCVPYHMSKYGAFSLRKMCKVQE